MYRGHVTEAIPVPLIREQTDVNQRAYATESRPM